MKKALPKDYVGFEDIKTNYDLDVNIFVIKRGRLQYSYSLASFADITAHRNF